MALSGTTVLVTGGGSGIGRHTALAFAREGANVVVVDLSRENAEETVQIIGSSGRKGVAMEGDCADENIARDSVGLAVGTFGELTMAVNCAGVEGVGPGYC